MSKPKPCLAALNDGCECPDHGLRPAFEAMREALRSIVLMVRGYDDHSLLSERMRQEAGAALALADKVSRQQ